MALCPPCPCRTSKSCPTARRWKSFSIILGAPLLPSGPATSLLAVPHYGVPHVEAPGLCTSVPFRAIVIPLCLQHGRGVTNPHPTKSTGTPSVGAQAVLLLRRPGELRLQPGPGRIDPSTEASGPHTSVPPAIRVPRCQSGSASTPLCPVVLQLLVPLEARESGCTTQCRPGRKCSVGAPQASPAAAESWSCTPVCSVGFRLQFTEQYSPQLGGWVRTAPDPGACPQAQCAAP
ncbi:hypothetical protein NDU88_005365 [Pleurodeles waltl]|uniref:Uncharacterized protein n=1 Tax=Pleurodeles waltl TaxID=8319 RepID=A0AAV7NM93_PLEWA|nr:hypothetical protein NDU88_005365 [Pleurodeles waltl]